MNAKMLIAMLTTGFFTNVSVAGIGDPKMVIHWGTNSCDAQLSIGVSNNVVRAGSTTTFYTRTRNLSKNLIKIVPKRTAFYVLTNGLGKTYRAVPVRPELSAVVEANPAPNFDVDPGEIREWSVRVKFDKNMLPGDYIFTQITEDIATVDKKVCTLESNSLKVRVVE